MGTRPLFLFSGLAIYCSPHAGNGIRFCHTEMLLSSEKRPENPFRKESARCRND